MFRTIPLPMRECSLTISYSVVGQRARLAQDAFGHADLAHVMEEAGQLERAELGFLELHPLADLQRVGGHALRVAPRVIVLGLDGRREGADGAAEHLPQLVRKLHALDGQPRLLADRQEQLQVALQERLRLPDRVHVDDADGALRRFDGHAEHGLDVLRDHALGLLQVLIQERVRLQDRRAVAITFLDDRRAEAAQHARRRRTSLYARRSRGGLPDRR